MDLRIDFSKIKEVLESKLGGLIKSKKNNVEPPQTVIFIDSRHTAFHYFSKLGDEENSTVHHVKNYAGTAFAGDFYDKFKEALESFVADEPSDEIRRVALVLPDEVVALDNIRIPTFKTSKLINNALDVKISEFYSNSEELKTLTHLAEKNKQYCTFNVASMQNSIINTLKATCSESGMLAEVLTYSSAATVGAVSSLCHELSRGRYLFLDIKDVYSRYVFVNDGRVTGFYSLPFGLEYLVCGSVMGEDMLYDHTVGELMVLNAHEKAKAKKLSVLKELNGEDAAMATDDAAALTAIAPEEGEEPLTVSEPENEESEALSLAKKQKFMQKKAPRKLPPYMQRPVPETEEGIVCENFRVFVKYALMLISTNPTLTAQGAPTFVSVNLPERFDFVFENLAKEEKENGLPFVRFTAEEEIAKNLELHGGLRADLWHTNAMF